ncbi:IBR domain-containing protein [Rutstroemia sp. NJR-2017a WRK4]|nr:IBR domain-containing protein [Rutstroemia sp. NJR-2017a WRK4]
MLPALRIRSHVDMQHNDAVRPAEFNDDEYNREVLQLEGKGQTETLLDERLNKEAEKLGISITEPTAILEDLIETSFSDSAAADSDHTRTASSVSQNSSSTGLTSRSSTENLENSSTTPFCGTRSTSRRSLSFHDYEKYLEQIDEQNTKSVHPVPAIPPSEPAVSLFSISTRRSYASFKNGLRKKIFARRSRDRGEQVISCICCREDFKAPTAMRKLPCAHNYCETCLHVLVTQALTEESKMPPRCCSQPIPGPMIKSVLSREEQNAFMKSVLQFSTPWESRIFCPNTACGEFIHRRGKIDPKSPFEVVCRNCQTKACSTCRRAAHPVGQDCPADWELDAVLKMAKSAGWRRCYKCRTLVELAQGCSHITCRCKAQFCYICGAVWDPVVGCPNYCNGDEVLERRRLEEEQRIAEEEKVKKAREAVEKAEADERIAAETRTQESLTLNKLRARQINERDRFCAYERKMKWIMWTRHGQAKIDVLEGYADLTAKMKERHQRTATHLEDRQVGAEMELRATLKQSERSVQIRLKHMEAYCNGLGRQSGLTQRVVTEKDLRELGQQYNIRDDLERLHQAKINVMRDKQAKQMENLNIRQEEELTRLAVKQNEELEALDEVHSAEEEAFIRLFTERKVRLIRRWNVVEELERNKLEEIRGARFAPLPPISWPDTKASQNVGLEAVHE